MWAQSSARNATGANTRKLARWRGCITSPRVEDLPRRGVAHDPIEDNGRVGQIPADVFPADRIGGNLPAQMGAEAGTGPSQQVRDHLFVNGALVLEQPQDLVAEELFENLRARGGVHGEESPVLCDEVPGDQQVDVGMPVEETPIALNAGHGPRHGGPGVAGELKEVFDGLIGGAGELG